jgi:glycosyltransferase involved in cell wall biosynthesis
MKIAGINMVDYGSTGNIMFQIADCAQDNGHEVRTFSKKWKKQNKKRDFHSYYGTTIENGLNVLLTRLVGFQGMFSYFGTKQLVKELEEFQPDLIHLHNLHDFSTCLPVLFKYIKESNVPIVWTLHDCWTMTGGCPYFTMVKCNRWKTGCHDCPQLSSKLHVDCSIYMWNKKKEWFTGISHLTIVTPSQWLANIVEESYLGKYPIRVINNGIDLSVFKPTESEMGKKLRSEGKYLVLGVALGWGIRKGLDVLIELAHRLPEEYQIVMVGTDDVIDKILPKRITSIHKTENQQELAELYTAADVFINPTREDNFPTTNIESLASGTPVITYKTGGSPEILDSSSGSIVGCDDIDSLEREIVRICKNKPYSKEACIRRAKMFDKNDKFQEYVDLFEALCKNRGNTV